MPKWTVKTPQQSIANPSATHLILKPDSTFQTIARTIAHGITNVDEAAVPAFSAICRELIQLTQECASDPRSASYRKDIQEVSENIAPKPALRSFLCPTKDLSLSLAQQIVDEMGNNKADHTTPARIVALKTALLAEYHDSLDQAPRPCMVEVATSGPIEYRSLIDFLNRGCGELSVWPESECFVYDKMLHDVFDFIKVYKCQMSLSGFDLKCGLLHDRRDQVEPRTPNHADPGCINGFRELSANDFPDPEKFACVERELAVICGCNDCELSLPQSHKRKHAAISSDS